MASRLVPRRLARVARSKQGTVRRDDKRYRTDEGSLTVDAALGDTAKPEQLVELFHILIILVMCGGDQAFKHPFQTGLQVIQGLRGNTPADGYPFLQLLRGERAFGQQLTRTQQHLPCEPGDQGFVDAGCFNSRFNPPLQEIAKKGRAAAREI